MKFRLTDICSLSRIPVCLLVCLYCSTAFTQTNNCPPNLDFEYGDFTNWTCMRGHVYVGTFPGELNVLDLSETPPEYVHTIIPSSNKSLDIYGRFPKSCPNGSGYSVLLGNTSGGHEAEGISYTFTVPAGTSQFSVTYHYAVVLENPNHAEFEQPRFRARIIDMEDTSQINCVSFDFVASGSLPGFKPSALRPSVIYKDWTPVTVDLTRYAGKTVKIEFITSDCTNNQHFGYAYVDVSSGCSNSLATASICEGDNFLTLAAPYGFESYQWYMNNDYSTQVGDSGVYFVNPLPASALSYAVIVTPYPGYGCTDTLIAPVNRQPKPDFNAGTDREIFCNQSVQLGSAADLRYSYAWSPVEKLTGAATANPWTSQYIFDPVRFRVKVTDNHTACVTEDSVLIVPVNCFVFVPSAFTPNGDGLNDKLVPHLGGIRGFKRFSIYNRGGNLVFTTSTEGEGWDGTYKGTKQDTGVFVWVLEYTSMDNKPAVGRGTILLIR